VIYRSVTGLGVWSAPANLEAPDVVRQAMGAQVIGGCCGTGPAHIAAVRAAILGS